MSFQTSNDKRYENLGLDQGYLATRIESLGLSRRTQNCLVNANIRTIGGVIRRSGFSLMGIRGLGHKGIDEIQAKLKEHIHTQAKLVSLSPEDITLINQVPSGISTKIKLGQLISEMDIVSVFAKYFGVDKRLIESKTRKSDVVAKRDIIVYALRKYAEMSFPAIGKLLGGRDHTTVLHSFRKVEERIKQDTGLSRSLPDLIREISTIKARKNYIEEHFIPEIVSAASLSTHNNIELMIKTIPERNLGIVELWRKGQTLQHIAEAVNITRERVRQIIDSTLKQTAINNSVSMGISIDSKIAIEEEKKKRLTTRLTISPKVVPNTIQATEIRWSRYYIACKSCQTSVVPHVRSGLCERCIGQFRAGRREHVLSQHFNKCDSCGILRHDVFREYKRDLYIMKDEKVLCRKCFLLNSGKHLGSYKHFSWSRYYENCISCGTSSKPYHTKGLCEDCSGVLSKNGRNKIISQHGNKCDYCGKERTQSSTAKTRGLHILKDKSVACQKCFVTSQVGTSLKLKARPYGVL